MIVPGEHQESKIYLFKPPYTLVLKMVMHLGTTNTIKGFWIGRINHNQEDSFPYDESIAISTCQFHTNGDQFTSPNYCNQCLKVKK